MKAAIWLLAALMLLTPMAVAEAPPLSEADFAVELPGGAYNLITDSRADLERITEQTFEFYDEFPDLGIAYDRLLTEKVNFFALRDGGPVDQALFKPGMATARGIDRSSTCADVFAAYGEPPSTFVEHGYLRADYEMPVGDGYCSLNIVINVDKDCVTDIVLNYHP